ncbi:hypothetical protein [Nonomuraea sp. NPDC049695]|uniref:hypothetical protein n=1 Tax=Nonomuraea sp. NPDC049695 TaxID=3154734 RepID=UPI00341DB62C
MIRARVRRFFCDNPLCSRRTFAEQVAGLTVPHGHRTLLLRRTLEAIGLALGGRPGSRLTQELVAEASRTTCCA